MTHYSLITHNESQKIEFTTDNEELYLEVQHYIENCVDAIQYRNMIERRNIENKQRGTK